MPVPKQKKGRGATHSRRSANMKISAPSRSVCPRCHAVKLPHITATNANAVHLLFFIEIPSFIRSFLNLMEILYLKSHNLTQFNQILYVVSVHNCLVMAISSFCQGLAELSGATLHLIIHGGAPVYRAEFAS